jgi:CBS domain-containing protein
MKAKVYVKFQKTGLGNMLLIWAKGLVFGHLNNIEVITSSWWGFHWGALIRRERKTRLYIGYFKETSIIKQIKIKYYEKFKIKEKEPQIKLLRDFEKKKAEIYIFNEIITDSDPFGALRNNEILIKNSLYNLLTVNMKSKLGKYKSPVIGVHIRRGDFKLGSQLTSLEYFIAGIILVRKEIGESAPVTIFTDASIDEIAEVMALENVLLAENKPDILDILLLSMSKVIILSGSSTFGYWAAFLSNAFVIRPKVDWLPLVKNNNLNTGYKEIRWNHENEADNSLIKDNINYNYE